MVFSRSQETAPFRIVQTSDTRRAVCRSNMIIAEPGAARKWRDPLIPSSANRVASRQKLAFFLDKWHYFVGPYVPWRLQLFGRVHCDPLMANPVSEESAKRLQFDFPGHRADGSCPRKSSGASVATSASSEMPQPSHWNTASPALSRSADNGCALLSQSAHSVAASGSLNRSFNSDGKASIPAATVGYNIRRSIAVPCWLSCIVTVMVSITGFDWSAVAAAKEFPPRGWEWRTDFAVEAPVYIPTVYRLPFADPS